MLVCSNTYWRNDLVSCKMSTLDQMLGSFWVCDVVHIEYIAYFVFVAYTGYVVSHFLVSRLSKV